jgi:hypothetical protein
MRCDFSGVIPNRVEVYVMSSDFELISRRLSSGKIFHNIFVSITNSFYGINSFYFSGKVWTTS